MLEYSGRKHPDRRLSGNEPRFRSLRELERCCATAA